MFESHFGLSGTPFSLNPDPDFYFPSQGHGHALSYLRFGVHQGEGFVVVTGEIGAGKTTLVRTLLTELDSSQIVAAQIVSTQLDAGDLLRSVAIAFGISIKELSKAELIASIEAFLTLLVTQGRRALLVIDEAQNLDLQAIEELRMLSNFQLGNHALLQSYLVGQPELRQMLTSKPMEQFRQRVIASCHLGPMDRRETQAYIEHRLRKVGWTDSPAFESTAFDRIFEVCAGIPRRVNLLCSRLLLSAYLAEASVVDAALVDSVAKEATSEVGPRTSEVAVVAAEEPPRSLDTAAPAGPAARAAMPTRRPKAHAQAPMLCVAANRVDDVKIAMLLRALQQRHEIPPPMHVRIGDGAEFELNDAFLSHIGVDVPTVELDIDADRPADRMADVMREFARLIDLHRPAAVVVIGDSDTALACALSASKAGCRVAHLEAGQRGENRFASQEINRVLLDRIADAHCASDRKALENLVAEGISESRVRLSGQLLVEATAAAAAASVDVTAVMSHAGASSAAPSDKQGYGVVMLESALLSEDRAHLADLLKMLRLLSRDLQIVWPMSEKLNRRLEALGLRKVLRDARIAVVRPLEYLEQVALLRGARCVLTDSADVRQEAAILEVPSLLLETSAAPDGQPAVAELQDLHGRAVADAFGALRSQPRTHMALSALDTHAGEHAAEHIARWIGIDEWAGDDANLHVPG